MHVIPAINENNFDDVRKKIGVIEKICFEQQCDLWAHLDVTDGAFTSNLTWGNPEELAPLKTPLKFEIHLMVEEPEKVVEQWLRAGAKGIIIHQEAVKDPAFILEVCRKYGADAVLSIKPPTPVENLVPFLGNFGAVQILAVDPGLAGREFQETVLEKIKFLRKNYPDVIIEVDGGINDKTARLVKEAGADVVVSASYIFNDPDPAGAYRTLRKI
ncbi:MAG: ribulose-phosphate 3-epimerase [Parcubacteria group bacterium]|nr:ribulose-phosphate 3-epimerase [Parcubacteria group bacterium]